MPLMNTQQGATISPWERDFHYGGTLADVSSNGIRFVKGLTVLTGGGGGDSKETHEATRNSNNGRVQLGRVGHAICLIYS